MTVSWSSLPPCLPCVCCKNVGYVKREGLNYPCEPCNGSGIRFCTLKAVRRAYAQLRMLVSVERGIETEDLDDMVRKRVERANRVMGGDVPKAIWFDALYFMARDYELLENWWQIAWFGRK